MPGLRGRHRIAIGLGGSNRRLSEVWSKSFRHSGKPNPVEATATPGEQQRPHEHVNAVACPTDGSRLAQALGHYSRSTERVGFLASAVVGGDGDLGIGIVCGLLNPLVWVGLPLGVYWIRGALATEAQNGTTKHGSSVGPSRRPANASSIRRPSNPTIAIIAFLLVVPSVLILVTILDNLWKR